MPNSIFENILTNSNQLEAVPFIVCTISSLILGLLIAIGFTYRNNSSRNFTITLALLPIMVQAVIMLVNGNLGTAVAVAGAFSLVRFRSLPGTAKEISALFLSMATGLATGSGYPAVAAIFAILIVLLNYLYTKLNLGSPKTANKELKITIPESLDYNGLFDDILDKYTSYSELTKVRTTNMGSLYQLFFTIQLKDFTKEKSMIDEIRCRNGNLDIICGRINSTKDPL